jgi:CHAD domain-containing protein
VTRHKVSASLFRKRLAERAREIQESARRLAVVTQPTPGELHKLHNELRRLRREYSVWSSLLSPTLQGKAKQYDQRLRHLARVVGDVRDRDVGLRLLTPPPHLPRRADLIESLGPLRQWLSREGRVGREYLQSQLQIELDRGTFDAVRTDTLRPLSSRQLSRFRRVVVEEIRAHRRRHRKAHRRAIRKPSTRRLHEFRRILRASRYLHDSLHRESDEARDEVPKAVRALQDSLGTLHDMDVMLQWLAHAPPSAGRKKWERQVRKERRQLRDSTLERMRRRKVRTPWLPPE